MDRQSVQFLCEAFLLLHSNSALANVGSSEDEKKLDSKPQKKQREARVTQSDQVPVRKA